jgi:hypothetical protein
MRLSLSLLCAAALASAASSADVTRTVIVMRHCVRTTPFTLDGELFPDFNDYSSRPFPEWKYPAWQCVPRGLDVIARQGAFLRYNYTLAPPLIKVISDAIDRDIDTSRSLLQGLGLPDFPVVADVRRSFHGPLLAFCVSHSSCREQYLIPPERESARGMQWNGTTETF